MPPFPKSDFPHLVIYDGGMDGDVLHANPSHKCSVGLISSDYEDSNHFGIDLHLPASG